MERRYTLRYRYSTDNGVTWTDFSDAVDSSQTTITQSLCTNQFKSAKDSVNFTLPATNLAVKNQLVEDLLGDKDLLFEMDIPTPVPVKWSGNDVYWDSNEVRWRNTAIGFTGYIDRSSVDLRSYPLPTSLSLTAYDVSFLKLDSKVDQNMVLKSKTITEIVHTLLGIAGYSYDASSVDVADNVTLEAFVVDKDDSKTYREYIDTLLFEAGGYVLDFMSDGIARIFRIPWDDANGPLRTIDNPMNEGGIQIKSSWMQNDGIKVKWSTLEWSDANRRVWRDSINRTLPGSVMQGETLAPGDYWPKNAELKPAYMEYSAEWLDDPYLLMDTRKQNEDLSVIMVDNPWADIRASHEDGSQYTFPQPAGYPIPADFQAAPYNFTANPMIWPSVPTWTAKKAWYLLYNSSNENIILTSFEIKGKVLYRSRINTLETDGSTNPKEYTSTYIYDATQAQNFLNFYWHFLNTSRFSMTWSEPMLDEDLGDVVEITQKGMAYTQDAVIVAKTMRFINDKTPVISYSAVGVAVPVLSNGVANSLVPQGGASNPTYDQVELEQKVEELEVDVKTWDFDLNSVIYPVNLRSLSGDTHIVAKSQVKGYPSASLEWEARDASGTTIATGSGSTFDFYIPLNNSYASPISVIMSDSNGSIAPLTKTIDAMDETEYDHDFGSFVPYYADGQVHLNPESFVGPDGTEQAAIAGDFFVLGRSLAFGSMVSSVQPTSSPKAEGYYEKLGSSSWYITTADTLVVPGKTYYKPKEGFSVVTPNGIPYIYDGVHWQEMQATTANAKRMLSCLGNVLSDPDIQPVSAAIYGWFENLCAKNAILENLVAMFLQVGPGDGTANSGFRFRALSNDGNGNPVFDVYFGDKVVLQINVTTGDIYFGGGFTYHAASDTIEANNAVLNGITINNNNGGAANFGSAVFQQQNLSHDDYTAGSSAQGRTLFDAITTTYGYTATVGRDQTAYSPWFSCTAINSSIKWIRQIRQSQDQYGSIPAIELWGVQFAYSDYTEVPQYRCYRYTTSQTDLNPLNSSAVVQLNYGGNIMKFYGLPTQSTGLEAGRVWNDNGTLKIVT